MSTFALLFDAITAPINMAFLLVMLVLFIIGWVAVGRDDGHKPRHFIDSIPTLLTSIGILGTFLVLYWLYLPLMIVISNLISMTSSQA